ncbi:unannotated protein [freshwater metagenome]|uniref:Unannotated protein n=1 Tax=freshwater metagenome TaxID=449393 RepID=A0A6J7IBD5_9ZZZZ
MRAERTSVEAEDVADVVPVVVERTGARDRRPAAIVAEERQAPRQVHHEYERRRAHGATEQAAEPATVARDERPDEQPHHHDRRDDGCERHERNGDRDEQGEGHHTMLEGPAAMARRDERRGADEATEGTEQPGRRGVHRQDRQRALRIPVVDDRHGEVDRRTRNVGSPRAERSGQAPHAKAGEGQRHQHQQGAQQRDVAEQGHARQREHAVRSGRCSVRTERSRVPAPPPLFEQVAPAALQRLQLADRRNRAGEVVPRPDEQDEQDQT